MAAAVLTPYSTQTGVSRSELIQADASRPATISTPYPAGTAAFLSVSGSPLQRTPTNVYYGTVRGSSTSVIVDGPSQSLTLVAHGTPVTLTEPFMVTGPRFLISQIPAGS